MTTYLITYDLVGRDEDYKPLWDELKRLGAVKILLSDWVVQLSNNAAEVRDHLTKYMDSNDRLFVTDVNHWAGFNILNRDAALKILPRA